MKTVSRDMLVLPLLFLGTFAMVNDTPKVLFEFTGADAAKQWQAVNDGVMGGVSEGEFKITEAKTLEFFNAIVDKILEYYRANAKPKERMGRMIERLGLEAMEDGLGLGSDA